MKMKRFISRLALVVVVALFVHAASAEEEVLYFLIDDPTFADGTKPDYSYVMVALSDGGTPPNPSGGYLTLYGGGGTAQGQAVSSDSTEPLYVGLGDSPTSTILFELWLESPEGSFERVAYSSASYSEYSSHLVNSMAQGGASPYVLSRVTPVPEPTSGLLMVLGFAGLALRRKRI